jgi:2-polyprenyl-3-methyl-5-hydroxy-6-metoxy-1,4-benzoquinol methylase
MTVRSDPSGEERAALLAYCGDLSGLRVLEIGCGDGRLTWKYAGLAAHVTAIDPDQEEIAQALRALPAELRSRVTFTCSGLENSLSGERFDLAIFAKSL